MTIEPDELGLVSRPCPLCGSSDDSVVVAEAKIDPSRLGGFAFASRKTPEYMHHRLVECPSCGLLYANPAPTVSALADAYGDADYSSFEESRCAAATYAALLRRMVGSLPPDAAAIDIGTGDGAFLGELLAAGVDDVVGIEPSSAPIAAASPDVGPRIRKGTFDPDDFQPESFHLVTSFQTLEHVPDPLGVCRGAHRLLRDDGALLVVCHNRRAWLNRLLGRRSPIYDVEHLQLFCPRSLRSLLERSGFTDIVLRPIVNRYPIGYWVKLFPFPGALKAKLAAAMDRSRLGATPVPAPVGNVAAIGYRRARPAG